MTLCGYCGFEKGGVLCREIAHIRREQERFTRLRLSGTGTTPLAEAMHGPTVPCRHCGFVGHKRAAWIRLRILAQ